MQPCKDPQFNYLPVCHPAPIAHASEMPLIIPSLLLFDLLDVARYWLADWLCGIACADMGGVAERARDFLRTEHRGAGGGSAPRAFPTSHHHTAQSGHRPLQFARNFHCLDTQESGQAALHLVGAVGKHTR